MKHYLLIFVTFLTVFSARAKEQGFILRGSIVRSDSTVRTPLDSVAISISALDDSAPVRFKMLEGDDTEKTNAANGNFRAMVYAGPGKYMLTLDREGFEPVMKEVERKFKDQTTVWVGSISMTPVRHKMLKELEVVQTAIKVVLKGDTIVYNADAFNLAEGSMLNALVKQLPGAELTSDGRIKVNGRFVSSLMLNGKDFFKDDPTVALENLPAYAVKNVKVYDKAADDDYLTQASQKLDRDESDENLVMDIVLKKEYSTSWMASAEAGYGTADRWIGKAFGLGFTDKFRLTAFVNANNVSDFTTASTDGDWQHTWGSSGEMNMQMGGVEYLYDDSKRWKLNGNATYSHQDILNSVQDASTNYYSTGNLYSRRSKRYTDDSHYIRTNHDIQYKGDDVFITLRPAVEWYTKDEHTKELSAIFNELPYEPGRVASLDSVFRPEIPERYNRIMLQRLKQLTHSYTSNLTATLGASARVRTKEMRGSLTAAIDGEYVSTSTRTRNAYLQHFGAANPGQAAPVLTDRYSTSPRSRYNFSPSVAYTQKWTRLTEVHSDEINLNIGAGYRQTHSDDPYDIFESALLPDETDPTMALRKPQDAIKLLMNSRHQLADNKEINANVGLRLSREPVAPSDSGFNPSYTLGVSLQERWIREQLDYTNAEEFHQALRRTRNDLRPSVNFSLRSSNTKRNLTFNFNYSTYTNAPTLSGFLDVPNTDNPLSVSTKNPADLKDTRSNDFRLNFMRYGRGEGRSFTYAYIYCSMQQNALGSYSAFNPETGVTRSKTINVNGNYRLYAYANHDFSFGPRKAWNLGGSINVSNRHEVGYYIASANPDADPLRTASDWGNLGGEISAGYTFKNGSHITLRTGVDWNHSQSDRADVKPVNTMTYHIALDGNVELPWQMELQTTVGVGFNRGYETQAANTTEIPWNATLTKSILKGDLVFKLTANDILNRNPHRYTYSSALAYTEHWYNSLPRYVLLSVMYRFRSLPKK